MLSAAELDTSNEPLAITDANGAGTIIDDQAEPTVSISDGTPNPATEGDRSQHQLHRHSVGDGRRAHDGHLQHRQRHRGGRQRLHRRHRRHRHHPGRRHHRHHHHPGAQRRLFETPEAFTVELTAAELDASNEPLVITDADGTGNIVDDQAEPTVSISDVSVNEGAGTITFTVTKSGTTAVGATVGYAVTPDTAGMPSDYTAGTSPLNRHAELCGRRDDQDDHAERDKRRVLRVNGDVQRRSVEPDQCDDSGWAWRRHHHRQRSGGGRCDHA